MAKFITLLRGINVGGHKKILMLDLRNLLSKSKLNDVQTYIQSGNIVFSSTELNTEELAKHIESVIENKYGFHVPTLVLTNQNLLDALANNPFIEDDLKDNKKLNFTFLYTEPNPQQIKVLKEYSFDNEELIIHNSMVYQYFGNGAAKAKFTGNFIENKLKVTTTSRNLRTVEKLISLST